MQGPITLYIIQNVLTGKKYIGITNNLERRLRKHKSGRTKGGQILGDFKLIHTQQFQDYSSARSREIFLKSGRGREWMKANLENQPPRNG